MRDGSISDGEVVDSTPGDGAMIDVLLGHDEDSDGFPDTSDVCPHIPDLMQLDNDGDMVGDACDPQPTMANQSWQLFAPLTMGNIGFARSGDWTLNADDWSFVDQTNPNQLIRTNPAVANVDIWVGVTVDSLATGGRQAAIVIHNGAGNPYFYGELYESGTARVNLMEYDGASFFVRDSQVFGGTMPLGYTQLYLRARTGADFFFEANTPAGTFQATFATPSYAGAMNTIFAFGNNTGRVHYIAIVTTQ